MNRSKEDYYKTNLIITAGMLVLYFAFRSVYFLYIALAIGVGGSMIPLIARFTHGIWMKLALGLGWINSRILLSVVYYIFLTPLAFLSKLTSKDPLRLKKQQSSLYHARDHTYDKKDLENPW